ncbi:MAG: hypothetical protein ACYTG0_36705 [Planctomycetota bacterium]
MTRVGCAVFLLFALLVAGGCSDGYETGASDDGSTDFGVAPAAGGSSPPQANGGPSGDRTPPPSDSESSRPLPIKVSPVVSLPQTLPTGTTMGFTVDYEFTNGEPDPSSQYWWVMVPAKGQPVKRPARLDREGELTDFFPPLRPENGPFHTHIEDAQGNRLSEPVRCR